MSSKQNLTGQPPGVKTHTHNRECPACKGFCKFAKLNSAEMPFEELQMEVQRRRRLERSGN